MVWQQKLIECLQRFAESGGCLFHSNEDGGDGWGGRKRANACLFTLVNRSASAIYVAFSSAHICCGAAFKWGLRFEKLRCSFIYKHMGNGHSGWVWIQTVLMFQNFILRKLIFGWLPPSHLIMVGM